MGHAIVVGAGPAGAALAHLLADRGVEVTLLERQLDFEREFRGEVLLPSGVEALEQMGLGAALRSAPSVRPETLTLYLNRRAIVDVALEPALFEGHPPLAVAQPPLLEAIVAEAARRPSLRFLRGATVRDLVLEGERVVGVRIHAGEGERTLRSDLVVGADGRASAVRRRGGFEARQQSPPMDIVWFRVPALPAIRGARAYLGRGHLLIAYRTHGDALQVGWVILKGRFRALRHAGIPQWVDAMAEHVSDDLAAHLRAHRDALTHPFLLDTVSDRVVRWWRPGALLLGDAAHTMSPVGGQGLNVALRDAVVAANHLVPALRGTPDPAAIDAASARVEAERTPEITAVQRAQELPPRVILSTAWWAEPLRWLVARLATTPLGRRAALQTARLFAFGAAEVRLRV
jgi:2-polyprenyl-6-methoxyphenol hydroxylase-like FAD-dependent oxidoreductase